MAYSRSNDGIIVVGAISGATLIGTIAALYYANKAAKADSQLSTELSALPNIATDVGTLQNEIAPLDTDIPQISSGITSLEGGQSTILSNQGTMIANQGTMLSNQKTMLSNQQSEEAMLQKIYNALTPLADLVTEYNTINGELLAIPDDVKAKNTIYPILSDVYTDATNLGTSLSNLPAHIATDVEAGLAPSFKDVEGDVTPIVSDIENYIAPLGTTISGISSVVNGIQSTTGSILKYVDEILGWF